MPKRKKFTIDDLAGMVQRGFLELKGEMNKRFDRLEVRMDKLEARMNELELQMSGLSHRMSALEERMDSLEESNQEMLERLGRVEQLVDEDHQTRITRLEDSMRRVYETLTLNENKKPA